MKKPTIGLFVGFIGLFFATRTSTAEEVNLPTPYISVSNVVLPDEDGKQAIVVANEGQQFTLYWASIDLPEGASIGVRIFNEKLSAGDNISYTPNKMIISGLSAVATSYTWTVRGNDGTWGVGSDNRPNVSGLRGEKYTIVLYANNRDGHTIAVDAAFYITIIPPHSLKNLTILGGNAYFQVYGIAPNQSYRIESSQNLENPWQTWF